MSILGDLKHTRAWGSWQLSGEARVWQQRGLIHLLLVIITIVLILIIVFILAIGLSITSSTTSCSSSPAFSSYDYHHHPLSTQVAGQPGPDSGYVSHSSGGGYPKLQVGNKTIITMSTILFCWMTMPVLKTTFIQVPMSSAVKSFTMSMDRGFLGGAQKYQQQ